MPGEGKGNNLQMASPFEGGGWNNASANNNNTARALPERIIINSVNSLLKENADLELTASFRMTLILLLHRRVLVAASMVLQAQISV